MNPLSLLFGMLGFTSIGLSGFSKGSATSGNKAQVSNGVFIKDTAPKDTTPKDTNPPVSDDGDASSLQPKAFVARAPADPIPQAPQQSGNGASSDDTPTTASLGPTSQPDDNSGGIAAPPAPAPTPEAPQDTSSGASGPTPTSPPAQSGLIPQAPVQSGGGNSGADTAPTPISQNTVEVLAGRVATLSPSGNVADLRIISGVESGTVTVNPDNTFALVMTESDFTGRQSFTYEATYANGSTGVHQVWLDVTEGTAENGWATGDAHYMLATDGNGDVVVEHGENHQTVHISGSNSALSLSDIAAMENMSVNNITGDWLASSDYGKTAATALDLDAGMKLWNTLMPRNGEDSSNWLLFERGYSYDEYGELLAQGLDGESGLNPIYIGAYGTGDRPVMQDTLNMNGASNSNVVIQGLHFTDGMRLLETNNIILDDLTFTDDSLVIQEGSGVTVRNSNFYDIYRTHEEATFQNGQWVTTGNYTQGAFIKGIDGLKIEGNFFDYNGWREGYDPNASASGVQPPIMFNHNLYVQVDNVDVSFVDNITMRASLNGAQIRSGGFIENNVYLDNNAAGNFHGEHYSLFLDNLITSGASKVAPNLGFSAAGMDASKSNMPSLVDNIVAHLADPDSNEINTKGADYGYRTNGSEYYDNTIVWNWDTVREVGQDNQNISGLNPAALNETTIQEFTAQLTGNPNATIADLADYLRAQSNTNLDGAVDADVIIRFFQEGFGIAPDIRTGATTLRFIPDDLGDGVRWDNKLNWNTEDLPGWLSSNDSVDLAGNDVTFGTNTTIDTLDFGPDGSLTLHGGRLNVHGGLTGDDGGQLDLIETGQLWTDGSDAEDLSIHVDGGRFANTGDFSGADLIASDGQTILATNGAEYDVEDDDLLAIVGDATVGFDGENNGMAILDLHDDATIAFTAEDGDLGTVEEFRSGAFGDAPNVRSGIDLGSSTIELNLAGLSARDGEQFQLMSADEIIGVFEEAVVTGLGRQNATVVIDYENDAVTLQLSSGNGSVSVETVGQQSDVSNGGQALWNALTAGQGVFQDEVTLNGAFDDAEDPSLAA